ncbi:DUF5813 family protein [Halobaculum lipolyticum]|uniref:DUF5813 family protein n=1 Tax=Halobaculum lipolyticum TaxID=3032001 RepID=A0ABD5WD24_9EURY|nr:DUF5813 family protein [Halobaculum sp. DT31]
MSDTDDAGADDPVPGRLNSAVRDHDAVADDPEDGRLVVTSTPFDGRIAAAETDDGRIAFEVTVAVPTIAAVAEDEVADVVVDGWLDTFERRIDAIGDVTAAGHDLAPAVERDGDRVVVTASLRDLNERRGLNDAVAVVDFVEGTYVQGVIPGYEYGEPVSGLIGRARAAGGSDGY